MIDMQTVAPGHRLGRYELLVPIAQGGMATVWAARLKGSRGFSKTVAIKSMLPSLSEDPRFEQMFLAEAQLASRIRHPNVCEILDLGEQDGTLYIVMEWVDGEPLSVIRKAATKRGGVPMGIAARVGAAAALGLHAAHELKDEADHPVGLVHRDVSPQNILVTYDGRVKIVDFGVAKSAAKAAMPMTQVGEMKGTLPFMSPEQARGGVVDRRSDVFSLGVVLYVLVGSKHPFQCDNELSTLNRIVSPVPAAPLASIHPQCPPALNAAIMKALEKNPARRHATMAELARALERAEAEIMAQSPPLDVRAFLKGLLGDRGERRAAAIRSAVQLADERASSAQGAVGSAYAGALAPAGLEGLPSQPGFDTTTSAATLVEPTLSALHAPNTSVTPWRRTQWAAVLVASALALFAAGTVGALRAFDRGTASSVTPVAPGEVPQPPQAARPPAGTSGASSAMIAPSVSASATQAPPASPSVSTSARSRAAPPVTRTAKPTETAPPGSNTPRLTDPGF